MVQEIPLGKYSKFAGMVATVDDEDVDLVFGRTWHAVRPNLVFYAARTTPDKQHQERMHRLIIGALPGQLVDHINGDGRDNRRSNLRFATAPENSRNARLMCTNKSGYRGVFQKSDGRWAASIRANRGGSIHIGRFGSAIEAALAYDEQARIGC